MALGGKRGLCRTPSISPPLTATRAQPDQPAADCRSGDDCPAVVARAHLSSRSREHPTTGVRGLSDQFCSAGLAGTVAAGTTCRRNAAQFRAGRKIWSAGEDQRVYSVEARQQPQQSPLSRRRQDRAGISSKIVEQCWLSLSFSRDSERQTRDRSGPGW